MSARAEEGNLIFEMQTKERAGDLFKLNRIKVGRQVSEVRKMRN